MRRIKTSKAVYYEEETRIPDWIIRDEGYRIKQKRGDMCKNKVVTGYVCRFCSRDYTMRMYDYYFANDCCWMNRVAVFINNAIHPGSKIQLNISRLRRYLGCGR